MLVQVCAYSRRMQASLRPTCFFKKNGRLSSAGACVSARQDLQNVGACGTFWHWALPTMCS